MNQLTIIIILAALIGLLIIIIMHRKGKPVAGKGSGKNGKKPDLTTLYESPYRNSQLWAGNEIIDLLRLKHGKEHRFNLREIFNGGVIYGTSLSTNKPMKIAPDLFEYLYWKGNKYPNLITFTKEFECKSNPHPKAILGFTIIDKDGLKSSIHLDVFEIRYERSACIFNGLVVGADEIKSFEFDRMKSVSINNMKVEENIDAIVAMCKKIAP